jgi:UDP-N-acetylglucosamine:LPS N-acetylglucosamine transferase
MESETVPAAGFGITVLPGRGLERRFSLANVARALGILRAVARGVALVRARRPAVVLTLGGYAAVPGAVGAVLWRVPLVIAEQNAVASLANRMVARFAKAAAVPVEGTGLRREVVTGNPVRRAVAEAAAADRGRLRVDLDLPADRTVVVIFGGSQGARRVNRAVWTALDGLADRSDLAIHHVVGHRDWPELDIARLGVGRLWYRPVEYEHRLPEMLAAADLAVCRSGASTVAELAVVGLPSILVPFPHAPGDAQRANAATLVDVGAAVVVDDDELDGDRMVTEIDRMVGTGRLVEMAAAARTVGRPRAAADVAELMEHHAEPAGGAGS